MTSRPGPAVHPLIVVGAIALVPALVLFAIWRWADGAARGADPAPSTPSPSPRRLRRCSTPLLSFRRTPGVLARDLSLDDFAGAVAAFGATLNETSCVAVELDGVPVGATRADVPLIPASNQKLLVGAVALDVLGPRHRFTTEVRAARRSPNGVTGDLYLVGGGDPLLTSDAYPVENDLNPVINPTSLDALADAVVAAGRAAGRGGRGRGRHPLRRRVVRAELVRRPARHRGRAVRRPARQRRPGARGIRSGRPIPAEAAAREFTQLLAPTRGDGRRRRRARGPRTAPPRWSPRSIRHRCGRWSGRCSPRATTTPPSCSSRRSGWRRAAPGRGRRAWPRSARRSSAGASRPRGWSSTTARG